MERRKKMLFDVAGGIRTLFQGHSPVGATVWLCDAFPGARAGSLYCQ